MVVTEGLELAVGPGVQDPVSNIGPGLLGLILSLIPNGMDLRNQRILVLLGRLGGISPLQLEIGQELVRIPFAIWRHDVGIPVLLDQLLEVSAIGGGRVGNVVIGEPALQLRFVPLVVCYSGQRDSY